MQIVIDIPDEIRKSIFDGEYCGIIDQRVYDAIKHGTPLPKWHGRLIDAKEVYKNFYCRCLAGVATEVLNETSTIIEAEKAESEVENAE